MTEVIFTLSHRIEVNALYTSTDNFGFLGLIFAKKFLQNRKIVTLTKSVQVVSCNMIYSFSSSLARVIL